MEQCSHWYPVADADRIAADLPKLNAASCCWFQTGIMPVSLGDKERGTADQVICYPGVHADVDIADPDAGTSVPIFREREKMQQD